MFTYVESTQLNLPSTKLTRSYWRNAITTYRQDNFPSYQQWTGGTEKDFLEIKTMNGITDIICHDLNYNNQTIQTVVECCMTNIIPLTSYIDITHLSTKSGRWTDSVSVDSLKYVQSCRTKKGTMSPCKTNNILHSLMTSNITSSDPTHL